MYLLIQSLILISAAFGAIAVVGLQIDEYLIRDSERQLLQDKFKSWWNRVKDLPPKRFISEIIHKISEGFEIHFGKRFFSFKAFKRCGVMSFSLLCCTLFFFGIFSKDHNLITPWKNYHDSMRILSHPQSSARTTAQLQQLEKRIQALAQEADTTNMAVIFTICYLSLIVFTNTTGFFLTTIFLRKLLKTLSNTEEPLIAFSFFVLTFMLTLVLATLCVFFVGVFGNPALWLLIYGTILLAATSFKMMILIAIVLFTGTWLFAGSALWTLGLTVFFPLILGLAIITFAFLALLAPRLFHWVVLRFLILCAEKSPIRFFSFLLILASAAIAGFIRLINWII